MGNQLGSTIEFVFLAERVACVPMQPVLCVWPQWQQCAWWRAARGEAVLCCVCPQVRRPPPWPPAAPVATDQTPSESLVTSDDEILKVCDTPSPNNSLFTQEIVHVTSGLFY